MQVSPNAHKIEEHRRKYERLRKERELRKIERERQRRHAEAKVCNPFVVQCFHIVNSMFLILIPKKFVLHATYEREKQMDNL